MRELPQTDVVFQVHPADPDGMSDLGFVNADGKDHVRITDAMPLGMLPVWSPDGTQIAYRQSNPLYVFNYYGQVALVGQGKSCRHLAGNGRVRWMPDGSAVLIAIADQKILKEYRYRVVSIDPGECEVVDEFYTTLTTGSIGTPHLSPSGLLAMTKGTRIDGSPPKTQYSITVVDLDAQEEWTVGEGVVPSWSPDGEWLAYTGADGIYVVRADGTERRRVLEYCACCQATPSGVTWNDWPPLPEWSPDGKWLVYHREEQGEYAIYKLSLETGEEVLIIEGGLNPDWRSGPANTLQE
ncbi:MAG: hypothetical protein SXV54_26740 [Chloroflexota bacterium]|nr:hypothetical protein [Chloroflexota bacterium]